MDFHGRTRNIGSLAITLGFIISFSIAGPAYAVEDNSITTTEHNTQTMVVSSSVGPSFYIEEFEFEINSEPVPAALTRPANSKVAPSSYSGGSLLGAARAQIGVGQDCTALVENALRMIGYGVGDVGPMGFVGYGVQVSPADAQPGDIMMRGGHVSIYAGNGVAVHGGYNGTTIETDGQISNPYTYAVIIRVQ